MFLSLHVGIEGTIGPIQHLGMKSESVQKQQALYSLFHKKNRNGYSNYLLFLLFHFFAKVRNGHFCIIY